MTKTTAYNTGLAKVAIQCSADTFVVNQTLVLRINICGENRHLRLVANRYLQPPFYPAPSRKIPSLFRGLLGLCQ
jgi:hypothetical protein